MKTASSGSGRESRRHQTRAGKAPRGPLLLNPSIGILICKSNDRTIVEYAFKESSKPIGVTSYQILSTVPDELRNDLPDPDKIINLLRD
jgi:hypothetical protein